MNQDSRDKINYILESFPPKIISNFISALERKTITLESEKWDLKNELNISSSDIESLKILLDIRKFESSSELVIAFKLLKEIKDLETKISRSAKLVCTRPDDPKIREGIDATNLTINELLFNAKKSITILGYLMTDDKYVKKIFETIKNNSYVTELNIRFIFDTVDEEQNLGKKYASIKEIIRSNWEEEIPFPKIYTYKEKGKSLHAKAIIIDSEEILITSANMSGRAIDRNFEMGICYVGQPAKDAEKIIDKLIENEWFQLA